MVHDSLPQNGVAERGMRTRAERARALLPASGLPHFLWQEAMLHATWLQNRTPAQVLEGKIPYKMLNKKVPNLAGIQEFGAAAYVKDLKAGKLDTRAKVGCLVGYDSESKGYRIYWPGKRSITVKRNVIFNKNDVWNEDGVVPGPGPLSEGENEAEKVIQYPEISNDNSEKPDEQHNNAEKDKSEDNQQHKTNSVPFLQDPAVNDPEDEPPQLQGRPQCTARYQGNDQGMTAAAAIFDKEDVDKIFMEGVESGVGEVSNYLYELPLDITALGHSNSDPKTFEEALHGPNAKEWQEALDYKINQLQKLGTWVVEDLPTGQTAIPCSEVVRVKRGLDGKVQNYRVQIVAGGDRQVGGVNYTETFSATAKMPTV